MFALSALGCGERQSAATRAATRPDTSAVSGNASAAPAPSGARLGSCPLQSADVRIGPDTIGGLSTRLTIGELRAVCPTARLDTVGVGGTTAAALRWDAMGATIWAIQSHTDPYGDSLHAGERADLWAAAGDSVRFPDGVPIPRRIGALRKLDSAAVVIVDHGDDGTGSFVVRCRYPWLAIVIDNVWPGFSESGIAPFALASTADTTRVWRIEVIPGRRDATDAGACQSAPAT